MNNTILISKNIIKIFLPCQQYEIFILFAENKRSTLKMKIQVLSENFDFTSTILPNTLFQK